MNHSELAMVTLGATSQLAQLNQPMALQKADLTVTSAYVREGLIAKSWRVRHSLSVLEPGLR